MDFIVAQDIDWCKGGDKENPHRPIVDKSRWGLPKPFWVNPMSTATSYFTNASPMPRKRKPPLTEDAMVSEGGTVK